MEEEKYTPPEIWEWNNQSGGKFTNINRPISGATHEKDLPRGKWRNLSSKEVGFLKMMS